MDRITVSKKTQPELPWKLIYFLRGAVALAATLLVLALWLLSRVDRSEIRTQTIQQPVESRMLTAIIPSDDQAWFFKMVGPEKPVASQRRAFRQLIKSVRFDSQSGEPSWQLPAGWRQLPDDAPQNRGTIPRFATLQAPAAGTTLELSVTNLPYDSREGDGYLLANINRWRKQLQLRELGLNELASRTEMIEASGVTATLAEMAGKRPTNKQTSAPFARGSSLTGDSSTTSPSGTSVRQPTFSAPESWSAGGATSMSLASFQVQQDDREVRITVTPLPPSDLLANVNRWRSQISLEAVNRDQLDELVTKVKMGEVDGDYVALQAPEQTILGVIAVHDDLAWFIKLMGDTSLAQEERGRFEQFVRSFRFN